MGKIIAVANQKGGVGKTTTSINLAAGLASLHKNILLVDSDPQGNATMGCGVDKFSLDASVSDLLLDGVSVADLAIRVEADADVVGEGDNNKNSNGKSQSSKNGWDLLPGNSDLTSAEIELLDLPQREQRLATVLHAARDSYDYILIDCPPSLNILTLNAFVAADSVLVPIQCEYYALEGLSALLQTVDDVREAVNEKLHIEGLLRTMFDSRNRLAKDVSDQLQEHFGDLVLRTVIPRNVRLAEAPSHGMSVVGYDRASRGALAYLALAGEIVRRQSVTPAADRQTSAAATDEALLAADKQVVERKKKTMKKYSEIRIEVA